MKKIMDKLRYKIRSRWKTYFHQKKQQKIRKRILSYYTQHAPENTEIQEAVGYLSEHPLTTFYGTFQEKYQADQIKVYTDTANGLPYVMAEGKSFFSNARITNEQCSCFTMPYAQSRTRMPLTVILILHSGYIMRMYWQMWGVQRDTFHCCMWKI